MARFKGRIVGIPISARPEVTSASAVFSVV
jgi:hypothetical protein